VVGTSIAYEGMPQEGLDEIKRAADAPSELARHIVDLSQDADRWEQISRAGIAYAEQHFSTKALILQVAHILEAATNAHAKQIAAQ